VAEEIKECRVFQEWFDPYDLQHIEWARQYLVDPRFKWEPYVPLNVVVPNDYGVQMHILKVLSSCWVLFKLVGVKDKPMTH
jgi:hypothetical protein